MTSGNKGTSFWVDDILGELTNGNWKTSTPNHGSPVNAADPNNGPVTGLTTASLANAISALRASQAASNSLGASIVVFNTLPLPLSPHLGQWVYEGLDTLETVKHEGIQVGEKLGWRIWRIKDGKLWPFYYDRVWEPGEPMVGSASDFGKDGVWAFKERHRAVEKMEENRREDNYALGSVHLWGDMVEHEEGWRAEFAKVVSIDDVQVFKHGRKVIEMDNVFDAPRIRIIPGFSDPDKVLSDLRKLYKV